MIESAIWASVVIYLLWRVEVGFKAWLSNQSPLNSRQYSELRKDIEVLQNQVNSITIQRGIDG
jgi:hypothetical protein